MFSIRDVSGSIDDGFVYEYNFYVDIKEPSYVITGQIIGLSYPLENHTLTDAEDLRHDLSIVLGSIIAGSSSLRLMR